VHHTRRQGAEPIEPKDEYLWAYIAEGDQQAVARDIRRIRILILITVLAMTAAMAFAVAVAYLDVSERLSVNRALAIIGVATTIAVVVAYVVLPRTVKAHAVWVGGDFIKTEGIPPQGYASMVKFDDIVRVRLAVSKTRIVGATIAARSGLVLIRRVKQPAMVIRAIYEKAPKGVKWRRTWLPLTRLSRDDVRHMLDQAGAADIDSLLPPGRTYSGAGEWFSRKRPAEARPGPKGWWDCLTGAKIYKRTFASTELPTPASLYVNFMLLQMLEDGSTTRLLQRSQPLPTLTRDSQTAPPPPLEDVVDRLKRMCNIDPDRSASPVDGTLELQIGDDPGQARPRKLHCRFNDAADTRCKIRLEISPP
jgi:hypothetical protein